MPQGLQTWDQNGEMLFDTTTRTSSYLGTVDMTASGSLNVPDFSKGAPWFIWINPDGFIGRRFSASVSGTTLTWTLLSTQGTPSAPTKLIYGVR